MYTKCDRRGRIQMLKYFIVFIFVVCSGCSVLESKPDNTILTPSESASVYIKPKLELPEPLDLSAYKVDTNGYKQFTDNGVLYIGIPEMDMLRQTNLLLLLKNRIYELQERINTYNNLN